MAKKLWEPSPERIKQTQMHTFMTKINSEFGHSFTSYPELYQWSVQNIPDFWATLWDFLDIQASQSYRQVIDDVTKMPGAQWFSGARLNFAQNLLRYQDDQTAIIFQSEGSDPEYMSYAQLYRRVAQLAKALKDLGVQPEDRVVGFMPNMPETVIAMLAATSLGAIWSSCSPDFGIKGVLDRFGQIQPKVLFTADGYVFKGKNMDRLERVAGIMQDLPSVDKVVVVPFLQDKPDIGQIPKSILYQDFIDPEATDIQFAQLPFDHPLYIMYSSGTTGLPKCMVQSAGGVLLQHMKEHVLHTDITREDVLFYFTTCGWMMWNWLVSGLASGCSIVLFDGQPFSPDPGVLWKMAQDTRMTAFGTSAGYLTALENTGLRPGESYDLSPLRALMSTGSPLPREGFDFVYQAIKSDLQLASISGGTDLNGCFFLGNPMGPVYAGELQCRGLGMKVEAYDSEGNPVYNEKGELVCTAPFPSMPLYFWDDPDGSKYYHAYFDIYPGVWRHGDFIEINDRGGVVIYGRSDATLNPGGVRIGTAEIYRQVEQLEEIADSVVVGQPWKNDVRVVLFVKLKPGYELTDELKKRIRTTLKENTSPRHVPAKIIEAPDVPYTLNMKKVEVAVRKAILNEPIKNKDALSNPEILDFYANIPELQED
ncbi:MAG: acetoacetate--CoA ligase [Desulfovermiculus sp.]|nr:acetoacetate--CoA ligase [Desulfovermiculus sp.]